MECYPFVAVFLAALLIPAAAAQTMVQQVREKETREQSSRMQKSREIADAIPLPKQQSQRDIASFLKTLEQPPDIERARSASDAIRILQQIQYQRPYFRSGENRASSKGVLDTSLSIIYDNRKIWRPDTVEIDSNGEPILVNGNPVVLTPAGVIDARLRSYEGGPVGPTLRVKPGEILRVKLRNLLPPENPSKHPDDINIPHEFNTTNLHTHGLHVSPAGNGDNVLLSVRPGEEFIYEVSVPEDHIPGTFWYHAHRHGSTAMQVSSGMAGALIIESPEDDPAAIDNVPGIDTADERICVFQQISFIPPSFDFKLLDGIGDPGALPANGSRLVALGRKNVGTSSTQLYFRVFDDAGNRVKDIDESAIPASMAAALDQLKLRITELLTPSTGNPPASPEQLRVQLLPRVWALLEFNNYELEEYGMAFGPSTWRNGKGLNGWRTTINGQFQPIIRVDSGKLQRFRFIHAGVRDPISVEFMPLPEKARQTGSSADARYDVDAINDEGMREIAVDGIPLPQLRQTRSIELFPGYRSDVLAKFANTSDRPQYYVMWNGPSDVSLDPSDPTALKGPEVLAIVEVMPGSPLDVEQWPSMHDFAQVRRPAPLDPRDVVGLQTVNLGQGGFAINGQRYNPASMPLTVQLGRTDEWHLASLGFGNHPFHIHVNPFYVVSKTTKLNNGDEVISAVGEWKDTLLILAPQRGRNEASVTYKTLTNYKRYIGEYVMHCHILDHEDQGMMMKVAVENSTYELGTAIAKPFVAPTLTLPDVNGNEQTLASLKGEKATLLVFLQAQSCSACNEQMQLFKSRVADLETERAKVVFIAPKPKQDSFPEAGFPLPVLFDHDLAVFKSYDVYVPVHEAALHGLFIIDQDGMVRWREISDKPVMDIDLLRKEIQKLAD